MPATSTPRAAPTSSTPGSRTTRAVRSHNPFRGRLRTVDLGAAPHFPRRHPVDRGREVASSSHSHQSRRARSASPSRISSRVPSGPIATARRAIGLDEDVDVAAVLHVPARSRAAISTASSRRSATRPPPRSRWNRGARPSSRASSRCRGAKRSQRGVGATAADASDARDVVAPSPRPSRARGGAGRREAEARDDVAPAPVARTDRREGPMRAMTSRPRLWRDRSTRRPMRAMTPRPRPRRQRSRRRRATR